MPEKKKLSFLDEAIEERLEKNRQKLPPKKKSGASNVTYVLLGSIIVISVIMGLLNTIYRLF
ncbi:hypothetical protein [Streptococcus pseudoporcinus]|uniref:Uncharacterized protein n=1 Tax=Streptococcus pseudoporcinus LQ 940-04 TaxID=875093 RepID=G5K927_9STRE|nr:hypothetical protein [Streptococcus pseudoporcinus]EFR44437.1 hypothetical protein HMPREF9320_0724 [Streptococcus pseudoporcinus SPIN 20026]EHI65066.1 hypothetical protein STRPS_0562 [Streptococcus pseudoporcinus LQ 940-04]VEF93502.1 Uncharacterised protein [Streptococcus pseudoporcinus]